MGKDTLITDWVKERRRDHIIPCSASLSWVVRHRLTTMSEAWDGLCVEDTPNNLMWLGWLSVMDTSVRFRRRILRDMFAISNCRDGGTLLQQIQDVPGLLDIMEDLCRDSGEDFAASRRMRELEQTCYADWRRHEDSPADDTPPPFSGTELANHSKRCHELGYRVDLVRAVGKMTDSMSTDYWIVCRMSDIRQLVLGPSVLALLGIDPDPSPNGDVVNAGTVNANIITVLRYYNPYR